MALCLALSCGTIGLGQVLQRYVLSLMSAVGFSIMYAMRVGPSVAILNISVEKDYSATTKGVFLGSFYYG